MERLRPVDRVRRGADFERIFRDGTRARGRYLTVMGRRNDLGHARLGIAVGRSVGGAVTRNRLRRRLREAFRRDAGLRAAAIDVVVRPATGAGAAGHAELVADLRRATAALRSRLA